MSQPPRRIDPRPIRAAKGWIQRAALRRGVLVRKLPRGRQGDAFFDQAALLRDRKVEAIFDVGAYMGETARKYRLLFPTATIHCFEPVHDSFKLLKAALTGDPLVITNEAALGEGEGMVDLHVNSSAFTSSVLKPSTQSGTYLDTTLFEEVATQSVRVTTVDAYCERHAIDELQILKLDVQGAEVAALRGAARLMAQGAILLVYSEILVAPMYDEQPDLVDVLALFAEHAYSLYGLYNFAYGADTRLYQMDAIFLSPKLTGS